MRKIKLLLLTALILIVTAGSVFSALSPTKKLMRKISSDMQKITEAFAYGDILYVNMLLNQMLPKVKKLNDQNMEKKFQLMANQLKKNIENMRLSCKRNEKEKLLEEYKSTILNTCMECHEMYRDNK